VFDGSADDDRVAAVGEGAEEGGDEERDEDAEGADDL
jgi:hypothetical protein